MMCEVLILGLGWTGKYIFDDCISNNLNVLATTTTGRDNTIKFAFDSETSMAEIMQLPRSQSIVITFKITDLNGISKLFKGLSANQRSPNIILLGSTRPWTASEDSPWCDITSAVIPDERYEAEKMHLSLGGCVLNLAGLFGGTRHPKNWIERVAPSRQALSMKKSVHLIHGKDISRLVLKIFENFKNERFLVTDMRVYDWLEIVLVYGNEEQRGWVREIVQGEKIRSLPREHLLLERCIDSAHTWKEFNMLPLESLTSD